MPMGCAGIQLWNNRVDEYPPMRLSTSNKGWHSQLFYLKNEAADPLPEFTGHLIEEALEWWWKWGVSEKDKKMIWDHNAATPLLEFIGRLIEEASESWRKWGISEKHKKKIRDHIAAIYILKENGLKGLGVIRAYHARRVAPLMTHALWLCDGTRGVVQWNGSHRGNAP